MRRSSTSSAPEACSAFRSSATRGYALPDGPRIAIEAGEDARARLAAALAPHALVVPRDGAELVVRDVASARDALAAIAQGFVVPTLLLVDDPHADVAFAALRAGAAGVLARGSDASELRAALDAVAAGLVVVDPAIRDAFVPVPASGGTVAFAERLTDRERDVLGMLAGGRSNRRIAERLGISENTVKAHVAAILAKLGATTRTEAVTIGVRAGLVTL